MKKSIALIIALMCVTSLFAAGITIPEAVATDVRSNAMGGSHVADYTDYFTLYRNPSLLQKTGKHWYWDNLTLNFGGPMEHASDLMNELPDLMGDPSKMLESDVMTEMLKQGINVNLALNLPFLNFGRISGKGIGWGVYDRALVDVNVPSLMGKATVGGTVELGYIMGMGKTYQLTDDHAVSVGGSSRLYGQVRGGLRAPIMDILSSADSVTDTISILDRAGFGVDFATTYTYSNWLDAALVYHNAIAPTWTAAASATDLETGDTSKLTTFTYDKDGWAEPAIALGVGMKVPTWWSMGIISNWKFYADENNVINIFKKGLRRNPWLDFSMGTELSILRILDLRAGFSEGYLNAGLGMNLGAISWDFALYGKELSTQPGQTPQMNATLSMSLQR